MGGWKPATAAAAAAAAAAATAATAAAATATVVITTAATTAVVVTAAAAATWGTSKRCRAPGERYIPTEPDNFDSLYESLNPRFRNLINKHLTLHTRPLT
jgi:glutathionylspermidine synthase